ncbi:MAG: RecX family transcriptional regulator [Anaerolineales bacterium]|nr:RecX family transcriptional regulator [Anaerolineales bacterium]
MLTVTKLEPQKKNPQRLNVYLNGEFAFGISRVIAPWLKEGSELNQQKITSLITEDEIEKAYQRALNFLSYRNRSEQEIRLNLQKHQIPEMIIQPVLDRLREVSLVNDIEFAQNWIENRREFHPRGKRALRSELYRKGISDQIIEEALQDINEEELALKLARKKIGKLKNLDKSTFQEKMYGFLSRRGFHYSLSKEVVNHLWNELEKES